MDQPFLPVETAMEAQLNHNISQVPSNNLHLQQQHQHQHQPNSAINNSHVQMISDNNMSHQQQAGKYELTNPSSSSLASAQALMNFKQEEFLDSGIKTEPNSNSNIDADGLVAPIPPLHVQQQIINSDKSPVESHDDSNNQVLTSMCSRCKKEFNQEVIVPRVSESSGKPLTEPKIFKLCQHCRELQRQRSRRWQKKTKEKIGVCRRCGGDIPIELQKFVLCQQCRANLRFRKANRAKQGRCVHCSGPLDTSILTDNKDSGEPGAKKAKNFKVCKRCRENDKIRRNNLEKLGNCNRCAKPLDNDDVGKHKVCKTCRNKKRKLSNTGIATIPMHMPMAAGNATPQGQAFFDNEQLMNESNMMNGGYMGHTFQYQNQQHPPPHPHHPPAHLQQQQLQQQQQQLHQQQHAGHQNHHALPPQFPIPQSSVVYNQYDLNNQMRMMNQKMQLPLHMVPDSQAQMQPGVQSIQAPLHLNQGALPINHNQQLQMGQQLNPLVNQGQMNHQGQMMMNQMQTLPQVTYNHNM